MTETLISMYVTLMPPVFAGILNMVWCKVGILKFLSKPMDFGKCLKDGRRIFGDNKTWKGFLGYLLFNVITAVAWGAVCKGNAYLNAHNYLYANYDNNVRYNLVMGLLLGLGYALFELPNSFIKRRIGIVPGKRSEGAEKYFFAVLDQADSVFGCVLAVCLVYPMSVFLYFGYVLVGTVTHMVLNMLLYFAHLRKNLI